MNGPAIPLSTSIGKPHPRLLGARCESCVLSRDPNWNGGDTLVPGTSPIPDEEKPTALFAVVGEAPGEEEVKYHAPFIGASGKKLADAMLELGISRGQHDLYNVCACRPPGNDMGQAVRVAKAAGLPSPIDCCRPRLLAALKAKGHTRAIALGGTAAKLLMQSAQGIFSLRGGPAVVPWPDLLAGGSTSAGDEEDEEEGGTRGPAYLKVIEPGSAESADVLQVLPTFHPAFVARSRRWRPIFLADLGRAFRLFRGALRWTDPTFHYQPTADQLYHWLTTATIDGQRPQFWTYDYETTIADPLTNDLLCIGIGLRDEVYVVGFRSCEDGRQLEPLYDPAERQRIREVIRWFLTSPEHHKVGHNSGYFDRMVSEHHFGVTPNPHTDTILVHRLENSELPHGLGVVGSIHTDVTAWKNDNDGKKMATHARTDADLWKYCGLDCVVDWRCLPPMVETVHRRQLQVSGALGVVDGSTGVPVDRCPALPTHSLLKVDHLRQSICVGMHRNGVWVDQVERARLEKKYVKEAVQLAKEIRAISEKAGWGRFDPDAIDEGSFDEHEDEEELEDLKVAYAEGALNPGSYDNIRDLLYEKWGLVPVLFTKTGLPSTSNLAIRTHLADRALTRDQRAFLDALRRYRRIKDKYLGTCIRKAALGDTDGLNVHLYQVQGKRKMLEKRAKAFAWPSDGRIRSTWNSHVTPVGRYASSNPNLQNQPKKVRSMYGPAPGHVWVKADLDQAHLRIIANRWKIARLIDCFHTGRDPHMLLGLDLFGDKLAKAEGWDGDLRHKPAGGSTADKIRDTSKTLRYTGAYKASCPTIWKTMTRAENKAGELIYLDLTLREVTTLYNTWMQAEPEWRAAWDFELRLFQQFGFTCDSILGRRCDFTDWVSGEDRTGDEDDVQNAIINFPILTSEASVMALAELEVVEQIPFEKWGPGTGSVAQVHDELVVECPDDPDIAEWTKGVVQRAMNRIIPGWDVPMTADATIARRWKEIA